MKDPRNLERRMEWRSGKTLTRRHLMSHTPGNNWYDSLCGHKTHFLEYEARPELPLCLKCYMIALAHGINPIDPNARLEPQQKGGNDG